MKPITELTIGHIGKTVRIVDDGIALTGTLFAIDAEKTRHTEQTYGGDVHEFVGAWENLTFTVGQNRINLGPDAEWEAL
jgi:ABC-type Fe2+-enterobactin transport system substrate-binding protein